jgi:hypothetical protein
MDLYKFALLLVQISYATENDTFQQKIESLMITQRISNLGGNPKKRCIPASN